MAVAAVVLRSPSRRSAGRSAWATTTIGGPAPPWWWRQSPSRHLRRSSRGGEGSRLSRSTTRAPRVRPAPWCGVALAFRAGAIRTTRTNDKYMSFIPNPHSRHHRSTRTHVLLSLSPHTIRRRHAAASSCTSCVPHGRTAGPTSPGTALLCYSDVFCVCFVRPSAQGRLLLRVLRAFRLLRCVKLFYQIAKGLAGYWLLLRSCFSFASTPKAVKRFCLG